MAGDGVGGFRALDLGPFPQGWEPGARACLLEAVRHGGGAHRPHDLLKDANSSRRGDRRIWA